MNRTTFRAMLVLGVALTAGCAAEVSEATGDGGLVIPDVPATEDTTPDHGGGEVDGTSSDVPDTPERDRRIGCRERCRGCARHARRTEAEVIADVDPDPGPEVETQPGDAFPDIPDEGTDAIYDAQTDVSPDVEPDAPGEDAGPETDTALDTDITLDAEADAPPDASDTIDAVEVVEDVEVDTGPVACDPPLNLEAPEYAARLTQVQLVATGGTGDYVFAIDSNESGGIVNPTTGQWIPGDGAGFDTVSVTDAGCIGEAMATVEVVGALVVEPGGAVVPTGTSWELRRAGGQQHRHLLHGPRRLWCDHHARGLLRGGPVEGTDKIVAVDVAVGYEANITVIVDDTLGRCGRPSPTTRFRWATSRPTTCSAGRGSSISSRTSRAR